MQSAAAFVASARNSRFNHKMSSTPRVDVFPRSPRQTSLASEASKPREGGLLSSSVCERKARPIQREESDREFRAAGEGEIGQGFAEHAGEFKAVAGEAGG
jgi:hypothetical protein